MCNFPPVQQSSLCRHTLLMTFPSLLQTQTSALIITPLSETSSQLTAWLPEQQEPLVRDSKAGREQEGKGKRLELNILWPLCRLG